MAGEWAELARQMAAVVREQAALDVRRGRLEHRLTEMLRQEDQELQSARERSQSGVGSWDSGVDVLPRVAVVPPFMPAVDVAPGYPATTPAACVSQECPGALCEWEGAGLDHVHTADGDVVASASQM